MNITSLPPELPLKKLVFSHRAILNTCKSEIQHTNILCEMEEFFYTEKSEIFAVVLVKICVFEDVTVCQLV